MDFNNMYLKTEAREPNLKISINTDDIGVFDTLLSNEYAVLFGAIRDKRHHEGQLNDEPIYEYLDYIRETGNIMSFCKKQ